MASLKNISQVTYVVKSLLRQNMNDDDIQRLGEDLKVLQSTEHPSLAKICSCFIDHRYVHVVMEHCTGSDLFEHIITMQSFTERQTAEVMKKML